MKHVSAIATRSLNYLRYTLFSSISFVKSAVYNSLIRPLLEYTSPVWCLHLTKTLINWKQVNDVPSIISVQKYCFLRKSLLANVPLSKSLLLASQASFGLPTRVIKLL